MFKALLNMDAKVFEKFTINLIKKPLKNKKKLKK